MAYQLKTSYKRAGVYLGAGVVGRGLGDLDVLLAVAEAAHAGKTRPSEDSKTEGESGFHLPAEMDSETSIPTDASPGGDAGNSPSSQQVHSRQGSL